MNMALWKQYGNGSLSARTNRRKQPGGSKQRAAQDANGFARKANASLEERLSLLYQQQAKLGGGEADPETLKNQLSMSRQEYQTAKQRYDATVLALQALEKASEELRGGRCSQTLCACGALGRTSHTRQIQRILSG